MKLALVGHGTRGDVQPLVCTGVELKKRGHEVRLVAPLNMRDLVERSGLTYVPSAVNVQEVLQDPSAQKMLADGRWLAFLRWLEEEDRRNREPLHESWLAAIEGSEAMLAHPMAEEALCAIGAHFKIPTLTLYYGPFLPSSELPAVFLTPRNLGPFNRMSHRFLLRLIRRAAAPGVCALRKQLGLPMTRELYSEQRIRRKLPCLLSYSPLIAPRPTDYPEQATFCSGIAPSAELKGAWGEQGISPELEDWLSQGPAPFYLGFGSMPVLKPEQTLEVARRAVRALGARAIIGAGWSAISSATDRQLRIVQGVDHAALFARCRGAVHHGGAGTTYASLRAGVPTLVASVFADQPFWGSRVSQLGVGGTIPFRQLNEKNLTRALSRLDDDRTRKQAAILGKRLQAENGAREASDAVEALLPGMKAPQ